ncbi:MAG: divergent polysaccharide deacetylase family protein [Nitrospirota bacterium]|nr:divergent polysaccharide deacetylase family protein [Nitrospirota bacterium]
MVLVILLLVAGTFMFVREFGRQEIPEKIDLVKPKKKAVTIPPPPPPPPPPLPPLPSAVLPRVSIVMDDLGNDRRGAIEVMDINNRISFAILPHQEYSRWTAEEGHKRGHDILLHIPMEATRPFKLGEGGIYTWMSGQEIVAVLNRAIGSIPHVIGVSNHMGSAFTQDERVMEEFFSGMKGQGLFFLDSLTSPRSIAYKFAKERGIRALRRDVFLDDSGDPAKIRAQWDILVKTARKKGHAIALAHPRENTLKVLREKLKEKKEVEVVPVSELLPP